MGDLEFIKKGRTRKELGNRHFKERACFDEVFHFQFAALANSILSALVLRGDFFFYKNEACSLIGSDM